MSIVCPNCKSAEVEKLVAGTTTLAGAVIGSTAGRQIAQRIIGMVLGSIGGAATGSAVPVIGTIAGSVVGAVMGAGICSYFGKKSGKAIAQNVFACKACQHNFKHEEPKLVNKEQQLKSLK